nr:transposase [Burkholderia cenocepacia]
MDEFKIEAVKQVTERGHSVTDVAQRLGITTHSLYAWKLKFGRQAELNKIAVRLDERPRRTLDFMSPADKLCEAIAATH